MNFFQSIAAALRRFFSGPLKSEGQRALDSLKPRLLAAVDRVAAQVLPTITAASDADVVSSTLRARIVEELHAELRAAGLPEIVFSLLYPRLVELVGKADLGKLESRIDTLAIRLPIEIARLKAQIQGARL